MSPHYALALKYEGQITSHARDHKLHILLDLIEETVMTIKHEPRLGEILHCAEICHEVNRAYCQSIGDMTHAHWATAPEWQRDSAIAGVRAHIDSNFTMTPEASHMSWLKQKKAEGWRYGKIKDPDKKAHPCFVNYDELPVEQQVKDRLFRAVVHAYFATHYE
jgi:hypothetical protein